MRRYTEPGPNPTRTLVANSQNPHSSTEVSRIKSWVPSGGRQFATSVNICVTSRKVAMDGHNRHR
jgi:hypothetical protein